ncbi:MAG: AAA family ATPase, partial [Anaerolineae bacterium]|nr:AAA family ATPase [Anaerolineae bacterium]
IEPGTVGFDASGAFELDLHHIDRALQPEATVAEMQAAVTKARGEFLEGFSLSDAPDFDTWISVQQELWQRRVETLFDRLSRRRLEAGARDQAVEIAAQWLSRAPLSEAAYRRLVEAHFLNGDRAAALQLYDQCLAMLDEELGVEPAPETLALFNRIQETAPPRQEPDSRPSPKRPAQLPLVGRGREHNQLVDAYRRVTQGETHAVTVVGEAGMGKTRLVHAFLRWAGLDPNRPDILQGRAYEVGGRLPYQPLVNVLRPRIEQENAPDDLLPDVWLAELSRLLPELRDRYPDLPRPLSGEADFVRTRLFEAVAKLLVSLTQQRPLILFIDDFQWADEGTRDLLHYLCRRWAEQKSRVLLLLTLRQEAL